MKHLYYYSKNLVLQAVAQAGPGQGQAVNHGFGPAWHLRRPWAALGQAKAGAFRPSRAGNITTDYSRHHFGPVP